MRRPARRRTARPRTTRRSRHRRQAPCARRTEPLRLRLRRRCRLSRRARVAACWRHHAPPAPPDRAPRAAADHRRRVRWSASRPARSRARRRPAVPRDCGSAARPPTAAGSPAHCRLALAPRPPVLWRVLPSSRTSRWRPPWPRPSRARPRLRPAPRDGAARLAWRDTAARRGWLPPARRRDTGAGRRRARRRTDNARPGPCAAP